MCQYCREVSSHTELIAGHVVTVHVIAPPTKDPLDGCYRFVHSNLKRSIDETYFEQPKKMHGVHEHVDGRGKSVGSKKALLKASRARGK
jgi:hypothetical protein